MCVYVCMCVCVYVCMCVCVYVCMCVCVCFGAHPSSPFSVRPMYPCFTVNRPTATYLILARLTLQADSRKPPNRGEKRSLTPRPVQEANGKPFALKSDGSGNTKAESRSYSTALSPASDSLHRLWKPRSSLAQYKQTPSHRIRKPSFHDPQKSGSRNMLTRVTQTSSHNGEREKEKSI